MTAVGGQTAAEEWDRHWRDLAQANARNPAQAYRLRLALALVGRHGEPCRLLDVGSGQGELLAAAAGRWPRAALAGVEVSPTGTEIARRNAPTADLHVRDLLDGAPPPPGLQHWATHAVCSEVLEHVDDPVGLLRAAAGWLAPGCRLVVTVPGGPMSAFDRHIGHRRHFSPGALREVLAAAGFHVALATGAGFPFFNLYRLAVLARGERLVEDGTAPEDASAVSGLVRAGSAVFDPLFRLNLPRSPFGWQTVAVARLPA